MFERDGWLPFFIRQIEQRSMETEIWGVVLDDPTRLDFIVPMKTTVDRGRPIFIRGAHNKRHDYELNFFPNNTAQPISVFADKATKDLFDDKRN